MPVSFQGGQALPAVGTAAYTAAQQGSGAGTYNPATKALTIAQPSVTAPASSAIPSSSGGVPSPYAVVTSAPATANYNGIQSFYQNQVQPAQANATATTAATTAANNAVPVVPGYNVGTTKTGAPGEVAITPNAGGQTYYANTPTPALTASDVQGMLSGGGSGTSPSTAPGGGQGGPQTPAQTAQQSTGIDPNAVNAQYTSDIEATSDALTAAATSFQNAVQSLSAGTIPLTPAQQSLVDATNAAFTAMTTQANLKAAALSSETGGVSDKVNAMGGQLIGIATDQAAAIAKMEVGFQQENYTEKYQTVTAAYSAFKDAETAKMTALTDIHSAVMTTYQNAVQAAQAQQAAVIAKQESDRTFAQTEKLNAETIAHQQNADYISAATLKNTEAGTWTMHDNPDGTQSLVNDKSGAVQAISPKNIVTGNGIAGQTGVPILDDNTKTTASGIPYIDGSALTGKVATQAQNDAANHMIPYIDKANSILLNGIDTSRTNLTNIQNDLQGLSPSNGVTRPFVSIGHAFENATQIGPGATDIKAYSDDISAFVQTVKSELGQNNVPRALIQPILDNVPTVNDTQAVVTAKIAKLNNALNAVEKGIIGGTIYDKFNPDSAITDLQTFSSASPEHAQQISTIRQANPSLTPDQVLQLVQP